MLAVVAALLLVGAPAPAHAADVSRTSYTATGLPGHPELGASTVLDVTIGREQGAFERHSVRGAAPTTGYDLVAEVFFATACQPDDPFGPVAVPEGTLMTDTRGDGHLAVRFPGDAFAGAPATFWVRWDLRVDGATAYRSGCVQVELRG